MSKEKIQEKLKEERVYINYLKLEELNLGKMAMIKHDEPNMIYIKREYMERFLNEFSITGKNCDIDLKFEVVDKF